MIFGSFTAFAETQKINVYLELKGWPQPLQQKWQDAISELATPDHCYNSSGQQADETKDVVCVQYELFTSNEQLKPFQKVSTKKKLVLTYNKKNPEIATVQAFRWDGQKLQRIRNSASKYEGRDLKDFILLWT